jgi:hypothetical protein
MSAPRSACARAVIRTTALFARASYSFPRRLFGVGLCKVAVDKDNSRAVRQPPAAKLEEFEDRGVKNEESHFPKKFSSASAYCPLSPLGPCRLRRSRSPRTTTPTRPRLRLLNWEATGPLGGDVRSLAIDPQRRAPTLLRHHRRADLHLGRRRRDMVARREASTARGCSSTTSS